MSRFAQKSKIVLGSLECLKSIIKKYPIEEKLFFRILIGSEGMGPEMTIHFGGSRYDESAPIGEIELWLHNDETKCVLIYSMLELHSGEIEHESQDFSDLSEAQPFFERAVQKFGIQPI